MIKFYLIISVLVLYNLENIYCKKTCRDKNDCITIPSCLEAASLAIYRNINETINKKFLHSICGITWANNRPAPQVCCSDFQVETAEIVSHPSLGGRVAQSQSDENDYTRHSNIGLLPETCGKYVEDRIVGGDFAHIYEFPWMALISYIEKTTTGRKVDFGCGGTIINSKYILTAAHCVSNKVIGGVRLGEYDIRTETDCEGEHLTFVCESHLQNLAVEKSIIHKNFHITPEVVNDIALLRVNGEIDFGFQNVASICLPVYKDLLNSDLIGKMVTVAGWGITETGSRSMILKKVSVRVWAKDTANRNQPIILAGNTGSDSCQGDSGGPLMYSDKYNNTERIVQYGIVSHGPALCGSSSPAVYTDVRKYMKWILDTIEA